MIREVLTADNSITYYNSEVGETYHSNTGAMEESFKKFAIPACDNLDLKSYSKIRILDMYYGLGYNSVAIVYALREIYHFKGEIEIIAIEKDPEILSIKVDLSNVLEYPNLQKYYDSLSVEMHNCDAYDALEEIKGPFDIIMYDSFSPKKKPELWTVEIFTKLYSLCASKAVLTTYSCARVVRDSLKSAGFFCYDGPKVGRRSPATIATNFEITT